MGDIVSFEAEPPFTTRENRARIEASRWLVTLSEAKPEDPCHQNWRDWLAASPANIAAWNDIERTDALSHAAMAALYAKPHRRFALRTRWTMAMAAAAAVALAALPSLSLHLRADHITGVAETAQVRLADGSIAKLGPETALRIHFDGKTREVDLLSGEASFDVRHNPERPFNVATDEAITTVLGTHFKVSNFDDGTMVGVARGHVRVAARERARRYDLFAGDGVLVATRGQDERTKLADIAGSADPTSRITVSNRPVSEVIERLRPWFQGKIVLASGKVGQARVTGVFDANDPVRALQALVCPQGGMVTRITPWLLIVSPA